MGKTGAFEKIKAGLEEALEFAQASRPIAGPEKALPNRSMINFAAKPANDLTALQRQALSVARQLDREGTQIWLQTVAERLGITHGAARDRLDRAAARGYLRHTTRGHYELAEREAATVVADPAVLRSYEENGVRVTVYAPGHAEGSTTFPRFGLSLGIDRCGGQVRAKPRS